MNTASKAKLYQGILFIILFLLTWFIGNFFLNENLNYRAGILGLISVALAGLLTPKMKIIESQSGQHIQVTSVFLKGVKLIPVQMRTKGKNI